MDLNIDPKEMEVLTKCIEKEICHDIVNDLNQGSPPPTYCKTNVHQGMTGEGTSRIDTIIANPAAANLIKNVEQLYTSAKAFDHTPFKCTFNMDKFADEQRVMDKPCKLELPDHSKLTQKQRDEMERCNDQKYNDIWKAYD